MAAIAAVTIIGLGALGSFIGSAASYYLFSSGKRDEKTTNEIKTDIRVMSSEIKQINLIEVIIVCIVVFVILSVILIILITYCRKRCKNNRKNKRMQISYVPREVLAEDEV